ncbi:MAG: 3-isopropylmalate dehydratase small subunit [Reyranellales bacterium]
MKPFTVLDAKAAPLMRQNVNTDIIIPIHRLRDVAQAELGPYAFEPWRYLPDGSDDPEFFLNKPAYRGAEIVVADNNFACGSSREGAVWAMMGMGVRAVIAPSFGPIFFNNCFQNGVLPIQLPRAEVLAIAEELEAATRPGSNSEPRLAIDLHERTVTTPSGRRIKFQVDGIRRDALLKGLNEVALTLTREKEIAAHQAKARQRTPWLYLAGAVS